MLKLFAMKLETTSIWQRALGVQKRVHERSMSILACVTRVDLFSRDSADIRGSPSLVGLLWRVRVDFCWQHHVRISSVALRHFIFRVLTARVPMEIQERPQGRPVSDSPQDIHCFLHLSPVQRERLKNLKNHYHLCYMLCNLFED